MKELYLTELWVSWATMTLLSLHKMLWSLLMLFIQTKPSASFYMYILYMPKLTIHFMFANTKSVGVNSLRSPSEMFLFIGM